MVGDVRFWAWLAAWFSRALARTESKFHQIFENNRAVKLLIDPDTGAIQQANSAAVEFYGYSREQLESMHIQDINVLPPDEVCAEMQRARSEQRTYFKFRHRLASGEVRDVDVFSSPVDLPDGRCLYSIILDVTAQRRAELRYRSLFEQSNDAVFILDLKMNILQVNHRAADMLGYDGPADLVGLSPRAIIAPYEYNDSNMVRMRLLEGEHFAPYERTFIRRDGRFVRAEINTEIVRDSEGKPLHIQSIVRDLRERKQAQQREIELALETQRTKLLMTFIREATHEFRTPLAVIASSAYLMSRSGDAEQRSGKLRQIEGEITRITRLVDSLLLSAKLESGVVVTRSPLDIQMVIDDVCHSARAVHGSQPDLKFTTNRDVSGLAINGHFEYLTYAIRELIDNAYQFTPVEGQINVQLERANGSLCLDVIDTGIGISDEDLPHIFEMFWRHDEAHSTPGFGLGLPLVKRIVELHGGSIAVESRVGEGTRFRVALPT
ncbi:MAG: PAS domain-containing sensor histidine kinase [Anaerolinea sp.]|nr:PAS domain-containing sensor histidine kinase [Anaerolinea sp.]